MASSTTKRPQNADAAKSPGKDKRSPLRARLDETTRGLIIDALVAQLNEQGAFDFSYFELARRAGVSVRTIYRHFPARQDLFDALSRRVNTSVGFEYPRSRDGLVAVVRALFPIFDQNAALLSAQMQVGLGKVRARGRSKRVGVMQEVIALAVPHLAQDRHRAAAGVLTCLLSAATWQRLREEIGLEGAQSGEIVAWAVDTLWRALEIEDERARKRT